LSMNVHVAPFKCLCSTPRNSNPQSPPPVRQTAHRAGQQDRAQRGPESFLITPSFWVLSPFL
jgi:hypothetical protein